MGRVYRAFDSELGRTIALKVLRAEGDRAASARLTREARATASLAHPTVVAGYDAGEIDGTTFIAMEHVPGRSLRDVVGDESVSMAQRLAWLADVARGLAAAHDRGLVHRDVKPSNVL